MLLKVKQAALRLNVSGGTVYGLCQRGVLPHVRIGGSIRIDEQDLADFIAQSRVVEQRPSPDRDHAVGQFTELNSERLVKAWEKQPPAGRHPEDATFVQPDARRPCL